MTHLLPLAICDNTRADGRKMHYWNPPTLHFRIRCISASDVALQQALYTLSVPKKEPYSRRLCADELPGRDKAWGNGERARLHRLGISTLQLLVDVVAQGKKAGGRGRDRVDVESTCLGNQAIARRTEVRNLGMAGSYCTLCGMSTHTGDCYFDNGVFRSHLCEFKL